MAKIKASTLLRNPDSGEVVFLREGEDAPAWVSERVTNPAVLEQDGEGTEADGPSEATASRRRSTAKK